MSDNEKLVAVFEKRRKEITTEIIDSVEKLQDIRNIPSVQVNMLSLRQRMLEDNHQMMDKFLKFNKELVKLKGSKYTEVLHDMQMRAKNKDEKEAIVAAMIAESKWKCDLLDNQIQYFNSSIKTVDNILFGIRHRIDVEAIFRPGM